MGYICRVHTKTFLLIPVVQSKSLETMLDTFEKDTFLHQNSFRIVWEEEIRQCENQIVREKEVMVLVGVD